MQPDTSTELALTGLAAFFVVIVLAWIIAFRRYGAHMVTTTSAPAHGNQTDDDVEPGDRVRVVEVPLAGAVDGGPLLGGRVMRVADRDTGQRRTVRQIVAPPAPATPISPISIPLIPDFVPDETPPSDIAQQQTQMLPALTRPLLRRRWVLHPMVSPVDLPHDHLN
jgi:hypothetical protein